MLIEKRKSATAVIVTLVAVTNAVPNFLVSLSLSKLEIIVPAHIITEIMPANDSGASNSMRITGQAEPSNESGNPKLIKLNYIIAISKPNIARHA